MSATITVSATPSLCIGQCSQIADYHACEELQLAVWGGSYREVVPYDLLLAVADVGGSVFGAWDGATLVGMAMSVVARDGGGTHLHLHLLGVLPAYRSARVGYRLMLAQREHALAHGFDCVTWTFDPLESANAYLYMGKLGGISRSYRANYYGPMPEAINAELPSDRLYVEWHLRAPRVISLMGSGTDAPKTPSTEPDALPVLAMAADGMPAPMRAIEIRAAYGIVIPAEIQSLKATDIAAARKWRAATNRAFTALFAAGYTVTGFQPPRPERPAYGQYLLTFEGDKHGRGNTPSG